MFSYKAWTDQCELGVVEATRRIRESNAHIPQHSVISMAQQTCWCPAYSETGDMIVHLTKDVVANNFLIVSPTTQINLSGSPVQTLPLHKTFDYVNLADAGITDLVSRLREFKQGVSQAYINKAYGEFRQAWIKYVSEVVAEITMK